MRSTQIAYVSIQAHFRVRRLQDVAGLWFAVLETATRNIQIYNMSIYRYTHYTPFHYGIVAEYTATLFHHSLVDSTSKFISVALKKVVATGQH